MRPKHWLLLLVLIVASGAGWFGYNAWNLMNALRSAGHASAQEIIGNPTAKLTIVEFIDYTCPYCHHMNAQLTKAVGGSKDIRIVVRPVPWLGGESAKITAFVAATAAQGKQPELHKALMSRGEPVTYEQTKQIAAGLGIDVARAERENLSPDVQKTIDGNLAYMSAFKARTVPVILIGKSLIMPTADAMPSVGDLRNLIEAQNRTGTPRQ